MSEPWRDIGEITLRPVGVIRSTIKAPVRPAGAGNLSTDQRISKSREYRRQVRETVCELVIDPGLEGILDGITEFSHIQVLYWAHMTDEDRRKQVMQVHPMGRQDLPLVGIFATRSPVRPNPILLTTCRLLEREENVLRVQGLEAVDGSPVLDIKPYSHIDPEAEDPRFPGWLAQISREISETT